ncbi:FAD-binding oxidoreductase [Streptomyces sp. NPDC047108]|uniref:FAD-binding oxidoreductase n=1 Tax=Streptomyces sp. NPDC047108 TaxID=3155025 RepID=UPI0033D5FEFB
MDRRTFLQAGTGIAATAAWSGAVGGGSGRAAARPGGRPSQSRRRAPSGAAPRSADWSVLARGLGGGLVQPGDADYTSARVLYNTRFDHLRPAAVAYVAGATDITECLAFARRHSVPVSIRNGGHSYAGWSSGTGRLVIDVSRLSRIAVDGDTEAVVGAGAKLVDVYSGLGAHGVTVPAGTCPTVGISGLTLGGGHGVVSRAYGLTCDSLLGATVVTADGKTVRCTASDHSDLFWALRGAGNGNFGVVTELRFRTHAAPDAIAVRATWPWSKAAELVRAWQEWGPDQPDELWSAVHLSAAAGGAARVWFSAFSLGTYADAQNAVDRLTGLVGSAASSVSLRSSSYLDAMIGYAGCSRYSTEQCRLPGGTPGHSPTGSLVRETYTSRSDFYDRALPADGIRVLVDQVEAFRKLGGAGSGTVQLTALGGAINRVGPTATAFVHRRSRVLAQYLAAWAAGQNGATSTTWLGGLHRAMRRHASGAAYQNYADPSLKNWRRAYYGPAAERLARLKRKYDPQRVFDFPQAL